MRWMLFLLLFAQASVAETYDTVIQGGRVIDPETGLDAIRHIGISGDRIAEISTEPLDGRTMINAEGLVVSPGFIDLHAHGQTNEAHDFQAHDGVTTALELEGGVPLLRSWLESRKSKALINFGASVSYGAARVRSIHKYAAKIPRLMELMEQYGNESQEVLDYFRTELSPSNYEPIPEEQLDFMVQHINSELEAGGIGIGLPVGYMPGASHDEIFRLFVGAADKQAPIFVHVRDPGIVGIQEVITYAAVTGAPLHIVHINSMALGDIKLGIDMVEAAQARGLDITTEMYPYTAASTSLESALFNMGWKERFQIGYDSLQWQDTGERLNEETFYSYRKKGGIVIIHMMKEDWIREGLKRESTIIASDGMPYAPGAHPRSAGTYSRVLGKYVRDEGVLSLPEALAKMTIAPAKRLETIVPGASRKGRLQVGADADITVFDPETIIDTATFEAGLSHSKGVQHVLVNGVAIVNEGKTIPEVFPGKALLGKYRQ